LVGAAVSKNSSLLGVGIDFEVIGRAKLELARYIRSAEDLKTHQTLSDKDLLTLIFSAKESLYKALYPSAKRFFGFETAALREIDAFTGAFKIDLITQITSSLGPSGRFQFEGRFKIIGNNCLTVLEVPN
jgi:enterobactin synthetase component D